MYHCTQNSKQQHKSKKVEDPEKQCNKDCINTFKYKGWLYITITDLSDMAFVKIDHHNNQIPYFPIDILQDVENFITDNVKMTPIQVGA